VHFPNAQRLTPCFSHRVSPASAAMLSAEPASASSYDCHWIPVSGVGCRAYNAKHLSEEQNRPGLLRALNDSAGLHRV